MTSNAFPCDWCVGMPTLNENPNLTKVHYTLNITTFI